METAHLLVSVRQNPIGKREAENYRWDGKSPYIYISGRFAEDLNAWPWPQKLQIGPFKLLLINSDPARDQSLYVRSDRFGALRVVAYQLTRWLDLIYRRSIITMAVWGLAEFNASRVPAFSDIKIVKRFMKP